MVVPIPKFVTAVVTASHLCIYMKPMIVNVESNSRKKRNWFRQRIARFQHKGMTL